MKYRNLTIFALFFLISIDCVWAETIHLNQLGFYPTAQKFALITDPAAEKFFVTTPDKKDTLLTGQSGPAVFWSLSGESVRLADFSTLETPGQYIVTTSPAANSQPFEIASYIHQPVVQAAARFFYYQRCSAELPFAYASWWLRSAGHPDDRVIIHPSAESPGRPAGSTIAAPKGWYDAGDYNKYVVNAGITSYTLMALYENYPDYVSALNLNIPEQDNGIPDLLDEVRWELDWLLAMQDPADGGVYHKLTHANFSAMVMPDKATAPRYVVQKSTPAALDFAAVTAQAARIFAEFNDQLPGLADSCLNAALKAWQWARKNPALPYNQSSVNAAFDPDIHTGEYGGSIFDDEFRWAAAELFISTGNDSFLTIANPMDINTPTLPWWKDVGTLGLYSLARHSSVVSGSIDVAELKQRLLDWASDLLTFSDNSAYRVAMGQSETDFVWGSNAVAANQGVALIEAYRLSQDNRYLNAALSNLDYLLGRNATGYSFVTEYGDKTPMDPHHRPSAADNQRRPIPGMLVGGPNPGQQDGCSGYPSSLPALSYVDSECSYASNEVAINWNAPLVFLAGALEAIMSEDGLPVNIEQGELKGNSPKRYGLHRIYPNPFNPATTIEYEMTQPGRVRIMLYNALGQQVNTLFSGQVTAGRQSLVWDGLDESRQPAPSGIYFVRFSAITGKKNYSDFRKIVLVR